MKKMILIIVSLIFLSFPAMSNEKVRKEFLNLLNRTDYYNLIKKIKNKNIRNILKKNWLGRYLSKHYRTAIYTIFVYESGNFRYKQGIYDKNDIGYCQVSRRYWTLDEINRKFKLSKKISSWNQFKNNIQLQIEVCSLIWFYNIGVYIINTKKFPNNIIDFITLYHSFSMRPRIIYKRRISKIFWKAYYRKVFFMTKN